jgi:fucose 4-O-acetylase-like acetyltransferase
MRYFKEIDVIKGIAIVLVLLGHSIIVFPVNLSEIIWCDYLHFLVSSVHMALFFTVSGFCYRCVKYGEFMLKKVKRLLIPYFVFAVASIICNVLLSSFINNSVSLKEGIIDAFLYGSEYWFLYTLFLIFLTFPLIEKLLKNNAAVIIALAVLFAVKLIPSVPEIFNLDRVAKYYFFFVLGYYVKKTFESGFVKKLLAKAGLLAPVSFVLWMGLCTVGYYYGAKMHPIFYLLVMSIDALFGIVCFVMLSTVISKHRFSNALQDLGKYSLPLYLLDGYLLVVSRTLACNVFGWTSPYPIIIFNMFVTLGISYCIIRFVIMKVSLFRKAVGM